MFRGKTRDQEPKIRDAPHTLGPRLLGRHAPGAAVAVLVRAAEGQLQIVVEDSGPVNARTAELQATTTRGSGLGLIGRRERAAIYGGCLQASRTAHGGFRLEAVFPVGDQQS